MENGRFERGRVHALEGQEPLPQRATPVERFAFPMHVAFDGLRESKGIDDVIKRLGRLRHVHGSHGATKTLRSNEAARRPMGRCRASSRGLTGPGGGGRPEGPRRRRRGKGWELWGMARFEALGARSASLSGGLVVAKGWVDRSDADDGSGATNRVAAAMLVQMSEEEAILAAVRAVFDGGPEDGARFLNGVDEWIRNKDAEMVAVVRRNRLEVEAGIEGLLGVRDALENLRDELHSVRSDASKMSQRVQEAVSAHETSTRARKNVDVTLAMVARAKRLVRLYALVEARAQEGKLHSAAQLVQLFDRERKTMAGMVRTIDGHERSFLSQVLPDSLHITALIKAKSKLSFRSWLNSVLRLSTVVGQHAMERVDRDPGWLPEALQRDADRAEMEEIQYDEQGNPLLIIRPLLHCLLVETDFGRLDQFRGEYLQARRAQLLAITRLEPIADRSEIESYLATIVGFFTVEKAISRYASAGIIGPGDLSDLWESIQTTITENLGNLAKPATNPMLRAHVQTASERVTRCMRALNLNSHLERNVLQASSSGSQG